MIGVHKMIKLTDYEKSMLNGEMGEFKKVALEKVIQYAQALGAQELCEVTKATVFLGAHNYLEVVDSEDYDEIFSTLLLSSDKKVPIDKFSDECFCQTCVTVCDQYDYDVLGLSKELFDKNNEFLEITKEAGVSIVNSCTPYLTGWLPLRGEHFVTTE